MPEPIRCSVDHSQINHTVTCEPVRIGLEAAAEGPPASVALAEAKPVPAAAASLPPGVAELVGRFPVTQHVVHAPPVAQLTLQGVEGCAGEFLAVAPLLAGLAKTGLALAGGFKVGFDLGACLANDTEQRQLDADRAAGEQECAANGGTVLGYVDNTLICERGLPEDTR